MKRLLPVLGLISLLGATPARTQELNPTESDSVSLIREWNSLEKGVRDGQIAPEKAREELKEFIQHLDENYNFPEQAWVLPIEKSKRSWVGGKNGEMFHPKTPRPAYTWYDGNMHGGHPGHDIFIWPDRNRDCLNDKTKEPFYALAMQPGVVVSINQEWQPGNPRGGKYVWLYNGQQELFQYYAHLNDVFVQPGQMIQAGDRLGTVGKTGFRKKHAHKTCHIHLMLLKYDQGRMTPYDFFKDLPKK